MQVSPDQLDAGAGRWTLGWNYQRGGKGGGDRHDGRRGEHGLQHAVGVLVDSFDAQQQPLEVGCDPEGIAVRCRRTASADRHDVPEHARACDRFGLPDVADGAGDCAATRGIVGIGQARRRRGQHARRGLGERQRSPRLSIESGHQDL